jgi:hypothetical protein
MWIVGCSPTRDTDVLEHVLRRADPLVKESYKVSVNMNPKLTVNRRLSTAFLCRATQMKLIFSSLRLWCALCYVNKRLDRRPKNKIRVDGETSCIADYLRLAY